MTREEAKEMLPIFKAFAEGKAIQFRCKTGEWLNILSEFDFTLSPDDYRIKSEPKYRPFKSQEECWNEMLKHPDFGWVKYKDSKSMYHIRVIGHGYILIDGADLSFFEAFDKCEFFDGTPFGIKEE